VFDYNTVGLNVPINGITDTNQPKDNLPLKQTVHVKAGQTFFQSTLYIPCSSDHAKLYEDDLLLVSISTDSDFMSLAGLYLAPKWTLQNH